MKLTKIDDGLSALTMSREEALRVVHQLINQLADAPGAGSDGFILKGEGIEPTRVAFMLDPT